MNSSGQAISRMPEEEDEELLIIQNDVKMDDETFTMHMNYRHPESLGGLDEIWFVSEEVTDAWRAFHFRLHQFRADLKHGHGEP